MHIATHASIQGYSNSPAIHLVLLLLRFLCSLTFTLDKCFNRDNHKHWMVGESSVTFCLFGQYKVFNLLQYINPPFTPNSHLPRLRVSLTTV